MAENMKYVGTLIKFFREENGIKLEDFAAEIDISPRYLQKIENEGNVPSFRVLKRIINRLSIDSNCFFYENYDINEARLNNIIQKLRKCNDFEINVISATLNALIDGDRNNSNNL